MSTGEYKHHLGIARGAIFEIQTQLVIARELGLANAERLDGVEGLSNEVGKMLNAILSKL